MVLPVSVERRELMALRDLQAPVDPLVSKDLQDHQEPQARRDQEVCKVLWDQRDLKDLAVCSDQLVCQVCRDCPDPQVPRVTVVKLERRAHPDLQDLKETPVHLDLLEPQENLEAPDLLELLAPRETKAPQDPLAVQELMAKLDLQEFKDQRETRVVKANRATPALAVSVERMDLKVIWV